MRMKHSPFERGRNGGAKRECTGKVFICVSRRGAKSTTHCRVRRSRPWLEEEGGGAVAAKKLGKTSLLARREGQERETIGEVEKHLEKSSGRKSELESRGGRSGL